jgi:hypothetical protein
LQAAEAEQSLISWEDMRTALAVVIPVTNFGDDPTLHFRMGLIFLNSQDFLKAEGHLRDAVHHDGENAEVRDPSHSPRDGRTPRSRLEGVATRVDVSRTVVP